MCKFIFVSSIKEDYQEDRIKAEAYCTILIIVVLRKSAGLVGGRFWRVLEIVVAVCLLKEESIVGVRANANDYHCFGLL